MKFDNLGILVPVRLGSQRIKNKVLVPFYREYSLLEWKIRQLLEVVHRQQIIISTSDLVLKKVARKYKVLVHNRDEYLSRGHEASFSEVITGIVKDLDFKYIAWVTAVVPLMSPLEYENAFKEYMFNCVEERKFDSLVGVNLLKEYLWDEDKPINYCANKNHTISQELPNIYKVTNGIYMRDKESILRDRYLLGPNPFKFKVSKIAGIDIDVQEDFDIACSLLKMYKEKVNSHKKSFNVNNT